MMIPAVKFTSLYLGLFALLRFGSALDVSKKSQANDVHVSTFRSLLQTRPVIPDITEMPAYYRHGRASSFQSRSFCLTPQQPADGEYKLEKDFCENNDEDCVIPEGEGLEPGSQLVYTCNSGYKMIGRSDVFCRRGRWSAIPSCVEVKCESLNSASTTYVSCILSGKWINCDSAVPPETRAEVVCRPGYKRDTDLLSTRSGAVKCNMNGKWEPDPIKCVPACGQVITHQKTLVFGAATARIGDFPWHASLFLENYISTGNSKDFICGATIIQHNLVLTAAHCVYDERTETTADPAKLFVMTGNIFRDYDSTFHNREIVRKAVVKNVYTHCNYYGLKGNYVSDIALLELQQPFEFSHILSPACLDDSGYSDQFLEPGAFGKVGGFGRTDSNTLSAVLQALTLPYISYSQCRVSENADKNQVFISSDKFCAGYNNGSAVCEGDSGGGLVFKKGDLWYVMGIVSVGLGVDIENGERTCDKYSYSLYTKVSNYIPWIRSVLVHLESKQSFPACSRYTSPSIVAMTKPTRTESLRRRSECRAPPRPDNGDRKLHPDFCETGRDCNIPEGTPLEPGRQLVYSCFGEFTLNGATDVYCRPSGSWTAIPTCTGKLGDGRGSIATKKCWEYANSMNFDTCPHSFTNKEESIYPTGKVLASSMEFPHMARVGYKLPNGSIRWHCGGTLISESFVVTIAPCLTRSSDLSTWVRVGDRVSWAANRALPERRLVIEIIRHPDFTVADSLYDNIALLRLENPVGFNSLIRPACLHTSPTVETKEAIATGWGRLDHDIDDLSHNLMKVVLPLVNWKTCNTTWSTSRRLHNGIIERQSICAGARGRDTCVGDYGGPFVIPSKTERCMYDVVGILSFNEGGCVGLSPSVFVRVYHYLPWIEQTVWGETLDNAQ